MFPKRSRILLLMIGCLAAANAGQAAGGTPSDVLARLGLQFEPNRGQVTGGPEADAVRFVSRGPGYQLFLAETEAMLALRAGTGHDAVRGSVRLRLSGANASPQIEAESPLAASVHYLVGADPASWQEQVPTYARVRYHEVYPNTDLVFYGNPQELEYDFVLSPGAEPSAIRLAFEGAETMALDAAGNLRLRLAGGEVVQRAPIAYQKSLEGHQQQVAAAFVIDEDGTVGFRLGEWDRRRTLVIDPVLSFATFLGGSFGDSLDDPSHKPGTTIAADATGVYVAGQTDSLDFPTTEGAFLADGAGLVGRYAFVAKLSRDGSSLIYATYYGSNQGLDQFAAGDTRARGLAVDRWGSAYLLGKTNSRTLPITPGAFQPSLRGGSSDGFVVKLSADGSRLEYATYLGGALEEGDSTLYDDDDPRAIAVDAAGHAFVAGFTGAADFPTTAGAFREQTIDATDPQFLLEGFVAKLSPDGSALVYSTYLSGSANTLVNDIAVDSAGQAHVAGTTLAGDFPTENALQSTASGAGDCFLTKLSADGSSLLYSTYLGGSSKDACHAVALDAQGRAVVGMSTESSGLPTVNAFQPDKLSLKAGYLAKLDPSGSSLLLATYLATYIDTPAANLTSIADVAVGQAGAIYAYGRAGDGFELVDPLPMTPSDFLYLAQIEPDGSALRFSTRLGTGAGYPNGMALDPHGDVYLMGEATSGFVTTPGVVQDTYGGGSGDVFVMKVLMTDPAEADLRVTQTPSADSLLAGEVLSYQIEVENLGPAEAHGALLLDALPAGASVVSAPASCSESGGLLRCELGDLPAGQSAALDIGVRVMVSGTVANSIAVRSDSPDPGASNGAAVALSTFDSCFALSARPKAGKVQLVWTHRDGSERYDVYRADTSAPSSFARIGETDSSYSTYLDLEVDDGTTYFYRVVAAASDVLCASSVASAHPSTLRPTPPQAPAVVSTPAMIAFSGLAHRYDVDAADSGAEALVYRLVSGPTGMSIDAVSGLLSWTASDAQVASHEVVVEVEDASGSTAEQRFAIAVENPVNDPPAITSTPPATATQGQLYEYATTAADPDPGDVLSFSLDRAPAGMTIDTATGRIGWTPVDAEVGSFEVRVRARDAGGLSAVQTFAIEAADANDAPWIVLEPFPTAFYDVPFAHAVRAGDTDEGDGLVFSLDQAPSGMSIDAASGLITWTPSPGQLGTHPVEVRVVDTAGLPANESFSVTVESPGSAPEIVSTPLTEQHNGRQYHYQVEARDPDPGDVFTFSLDQAPGFMEIGASSGLVYWPANRVRLGYHSVIVRVSDSRGLFDTQGYTLRVLFSGGSPHITSAPVTEAETGSLYQYDVNASDPGGLSLTFSLQMAPDGMTIGAATGEIEWTPGFDELGERSVQVAVLSSLGGDLQDFTITVTGDESLADRDGDGVTGAGGDCDDANPFVHPSAQESPGNGLDEDCDGEDEPLGDGGLLPIAMYPGAIPIASPTEVLFTTKLVAASEAATEVTLQEVDSFGNLVRTLGALLDDGAGDDLSGGDWVYSGRFEIESAVEGVLYFRARVVIPDTGESVETDSSTVMVTRFPTGIFTSDMSRVVEDPDTGLFLLANRVLVSFRPGTSPNAIETIASDVGGEVIGLLPAIGGYSIELASSSSAEEVHEVVARLQNRAEVLVAEPAYTLNHAADITLTDEFYERLWHIKKVRADEAWVMTSGANITIAVIDSGVHHLHEDLQGRVFQGPNYVAITPQDLFEPLDDIGHGTHVAGIAAAWPNNYNGVAGLGWGSSVLALKVSVGDWVSGEGLFQAIAYATAVGARVINVSLAGPIVCTVARRATDHAALHGSLIVASAGNENTDIPQYPAAYPRVLAVTMTDQMDNRPVSPQGDEGGNFGDWVNIAAPGLYIWSTYVQLPPGVTADNEPGDPDDPNDDYARTTGTSLATPMVAGAAALVWSAHPSWTPQQVRQRLIDTAVPLREILLSGGIFEVGRLDVFDAVFNGSFEAEMSGWVRTGVGDGPMDSGTTDDFIGLVQPYPRNGHQESMAYVGNRNLAGPDHEYFASWADQEFEIQPDVEEITFSFDYRFLTEEYPEGLGPLGEPGSLFHWADHADVSLAINTVDDPVVMFEADANNFDPPNPLMPVPGLNLGSSSGHGGSSPEDGTLGDTGWQHVVYPIPHPVKGGVLIPGPAQFEFWVLDQYDPFVDSMLFVDNIAIEAASFAPPLAPLPGSAASEQPEDEPSPMPGCGLVGVEMFALLGLVRMVAWSRRKNL